MFTSYRCGKCDEPVIKQLGQWFHRWAETDKDHRVEEVELAVRNES